MQKLTALIFLAAFGTMLSCSNSIKEQVTKKPNILFCIADDWGWPHAGAYGDSVVKTPTFDSLSKEGILFENAFVSSPSCTPSRNAILTGQQFWRLGEGANLWSTLDATIPVYPLLLEEAGYHVGSWRKSWGPGNLKAGGYDTIHPAGKKYGGFEKFLTAKPKDAPFCFWLGASDPHRPYETGSGEAAGIDPEKIELPDFYPDAKEIRSDIADYYHEVQRFDADVAAAIRVLDSIGELDNTIIVVTGDHGMPFPRCKGNLYDMGVRVPLVVKLGKAITHNTNDVTDFVSLTDLAPTFLSFAGLEIPEQMTGRPLNNMLLSNNASQDAERDHVVFGRERHTTAQLSPSIEGYPSRGIRTKEFLYIHNFYPDRWPAGVPEGASHPMSSFADCDNGPTKLYLMNNRQSEGYETYFNWSFGKRPKEELYDIKNDPYQLHNLASNPEYAAVMKSLSTKLMEVLATMDDPRVIGTGLKFDEYPYRASYKLNINK